jgi:hypothetical protein
MRRRLALHTAPRYRCTLDRCLSLAALARARASAAASRR